MPLGQRLRQTWTLQGPETRTLEAPETGTLEATGMWTLLEPAPGTWTRVHSAAESKNLGAVCSSLAAGSGAGCAVLGTVGAGWAVLGTVGASYTVQQLPADAAGAAAAPAGATADAAGQPQGIRLATYMDDGLLLLKQSKQEAEAIMCALLHIRMTWVL